MTQIRNQNQEYVQFCARCMQREFGGTVIIKITHSSDPRIYPDGLWFDDLLGSITDVVGVDLHGLPHLFLLADGSCIPSDCAEIVDVVEG